MADVTTLTTDVIMTAEFSDGSEKSVSHNNPNAVGTIEDQIADLQSYLTEHNILLSNAGGTFVRFSSAKLRRKEQTYFDIS